MEPNLYPEKYEQFLIKAGIDQNMFDRSDFILVVDVNSTCVRPAQKMTTKVYQRYPYGNTISARRQLFNLNRAVSTDRGKLGNVEMKYCPLNQHPAIVTITTQYTYGRCLERNSKLQKSVATSRDMDFVRGV